MAAMTKLPRIIVEDCNLEIKKVSPPTFSLIIIKKELRKINLMIVLSRSDEHQNQNCDKNQQKTCKNYCLAHFSRAHVRLVPSNARRPPQNKKTKQNKRNVNGVLTFIASCFSPPLADKHILFSLLKDHSPTQYVTKVLK